MKNLLYLLLLATMFTLFGCSTEPAGIDLSKQESEEKKEEATEEMPETRNLSGLDGGFAESLLGGVLRGPKEGFLYTSTGNDLGYMFEYDPTGNIPSGYKSSVSIGVRKVGEDRYYIEKNEPIEMLIYATIRFTEPGEYEVKGNETYVWTTGGLLPVPKMGERYQKLYYTVVDRVVAGTIAPEAQTIAYGATPALLRSTVGASGGQRAVTYQWQSSPDGQASSWTNITNAKSATYQSPALTSTTYFRRQATDGKTTLYSNIVTVNVEHPFADIKIVGSGFGIANRPAQTYSVSYTDNRFNKGEPIQIYWEVIGGHIDYGQNTKSVGVYFQGRNGQTIIKVTLATPYNSYATEFNVAIPYISISPPSIPNNPLSFYSYYFVGEHINLNLSIKGQSDNGFKRVEWETDDASADKVIVSETEVEYTFNEFGTKKIIAKLIMQDDSYVLYYTSVSVYDSWTPILASDGGSFLQDEMITVYIENYDSDSDYEWTVAIRNVKIIEDTDRYKKLQIIRPSPYYGAVISCIAKKDGITSIESNTIHIFEEP